MKADKKIILIDSNAIMHRAFHALPPLTTKSGEVVGVVYGFASILLRVIKELRPDYIACAFDVAGGTFRDAIFDKYKATRKKPDQEFYDQIDKVKEVVRAMNIPIYELSGFEADDVIGTLVEKLSAEPDLEVFIVTGDMDTLQLIDGADRVKVYALKKGISETVIYDTDQVVARYGLKPQQIVDYKALRGDASDNIPGVKGIGEKGAVSILQEFGNLENLYRNLAASQAGSLRPKLVEKLSAEKDMAYMSKELATIRRDVPIDFKLADCLWGDYDREVLVKAFQRFEFFSLIARLRDTEKEDGVSRTAAAAAPPLPPRTVRCHPVETEVEFSALLAKLQGSSVCVLQTSESEHRLTAKNLTALVFAFDRAEIFYLPLSAAPRGEQSLFAAAPKPENDFLQRLKPFLEDRQLLKIGFDLKRDLEALGAYGIELGGLKFDVMLAAYLLDPGKRDYAPAKLLFDHLGWSGEGELETDRAFEIDPRWSQLVAFFDLAEKLEADLRSSEMDRLYFHIELPLIPVLAEIELTGVEIDTTLLSSLGVEIERDIDALAARIHELSGDSAFNINSSKQLAEVLFEKMQIPAEGIKKGKTGYSVAGSELDKMRGEHPIIDFISDYRELTKLKNTYVDTLPQLLSPVTKRLHTTFHQDVTATGRLSSSDPNLQNIPVRSDIGRCIRSAFVAEPGRILLSADYSQIELRIIATIADDHNMQEIFRQNLDIHTATAAKVNHVALNEVTPAMRRAAKALNFGVIYGMSVFGFAQSANIDRQEAKKFIDSYMEEFSSVALYIEKSKLDATEKGYAETLWGRRRYLPELATSNSFLRAAAERMAINMPIQGTAADLMKINMLKISEWAAGFNRQHPDAVRILLQVHDELLFSIQQPFLEEAQLVIKHTMENGHLRFDGRDIDFSVPIIVSLKSGPNWGQLG